MGNSGVHSMYNVIIFQSLAKKKGKEKNKIIADYRLSKFHLLEYLS